MKTFERTIIIVEDDPEISLMLKEIFNQLGFVTIPCYCRNAVLKTLHSIKPDLITMDYYVNSANGINICREIRAEEVGRDVPILFMSATDVDKTEFAGLKKISFLDKPFELKKLTEIVKNILE